MSFPTSAPRTLNHVCRRRRIFKYHVCSRLLRGRTRRRRLASIIKVAEVSRAWQEIQGRAMWAQPSAPVSFCIGTSRKTSQTKVCPKNRPSCRTNRRIYCAGDIYRCIIQQRVTAGPKSDSLRAVFNHLFVMIFEIGQGQT